MSKSHDAETSMMQQNAHGNDGTLDRMLRLGVKRRGVPAIFIHAGAGFHSLQNERLHLEACVAAAEMGMKFLKAGSSATEAVDASLRILEDREITNAGYGSNLSIDGAVECDATVVDHLGRSGACGAVPNIRNPISLAKLILDMSNQPLSLRRVPPNILVGDGARTFAEEHGMTTFKNDYLISKNARHRFIRWQADLRRAEASAKEINGAQAPEPCVPCQYETYTPPADPHRTYPRDHAAAIVAGTWNEGQPDSPYLGTPIPELTESRPDSPGASGYFHTTGTQSTPAGSSSARPPSEKNSVNHAGTPDAQKLSSIPTNRTKSSKKRANPTSQASVDSAPLAVRETRSCKDTHESHRDGPASPRGVSHVCNDFNDEVQRSHERGTHSPRGIKRSLSPDCTFDQLTASKKLPLPPTDGDIDIITDTIGAIAIDERGHIAAGSSSGGIGMKHRGRLGPAALVGIGTAVVPCDDEDEDGVSVAAVTSGTGEHMATTMASQRCAERIYSGTRRGPGATNVQDDDDDAIMESFITKDFMGHPGVKGCDSAGAIGVMVVKKTNKGYYLYFAHNTDSFALASMGGLEKQAVCTMSRRYGGAPIAQGGRKVCLD